MGFDDSQEGRWDMLRAAAVGGCAPESPHLHKCASLRLLHFDLIDRLNCILTIDETGLQEGLHAEAEHAHHDGRSEFANSRRRPRQLHVTAFRRLVCSISLSTTACRRQPLSPRHPAQLS